MDDQAFDSGGSEEFQPQTDGLKKKTAAQIKQSAQQAPEDQSRGALHYGNDYDGDITGAETPEGAPVDTASTGDTQARSSGATFEPAIPEDLSQPITSDISQDAPEALDSTPNGEADRAPNASPGDRSETVTRADVSAENGARIAQKTSPNTAEPTTPETPLAATSNDDLVSDDPDAASFNSAPSDVSLSNLAVPENEAGAIVGKLFVADQDSNETHTYSVSDDRFEIVDGVLKLKDDVSLDYEDIQALSLEITVADADGATHTENFDLAITDANDAPTEITLSNLAVAENTDGAVVGKLIVDDQDANEAHSYSVSDDRFEVVGGMVKLKDGVRLDPGDANGLALEVTAADSSGASTTQSFGIAVADVPEVGVSSGFHAKYFDMDQRLERLDDIDWSAPPTHQELVSDVNYKNSRESFWEGGSKDTFGVQITGNIDVEEGGVFNFHIGGDDGVALYINGEEVVDNDGLHGFRTRSGEIELEPGTHVVEVRYFENSGHAGLKVEWEGPGLDGRELLTPPALDDLQTVNGMPLSVNLSTDAASSDGDVSQVIEGLPAGTVLEAGGETVTIDDSGIADVSGWDMSMLHITPPVEFTGSVEAQVQTSVTLDDGNQAVTSTDLHFDVNPATVDPISVDVGSGFRASYFDVDHSLSDLDQINWDADPTKEEVVGEINYKNSRESFWEGGDTDTFGARITGEVTIEEGGTFKFFAGGDDGVVLYVNGEEVIENDGLHSYRTRTGEIELEPGTHEIEVRYFENYGHAGLKLEWEGPGIEGRQTVKADDDLSINENGSLDFGISTSDLGANSIVTLSGLPADTILVSGENSLVSDGTELDLTGWDIDMIEIMPPNGFEGVIEADVTISDQAYNGETREITHSFELEVGDPDAQQPDSGNDEAIFLAEAQQDDADSKGWADESEPDNNQDDADNDDDVMEEPVAEHQSADQSYEMTDTYERNDW